MHASFRGGSTRLGREDVEECLRRGRCGSGFGFVRSIGLAAGDSAPAATPVAMPCAGSTATAGGGMSAPTASASAAGQYGCTSAARADLSTQLQWRLCWCRNRSLHRMPCTVSAPTRAALCARRSRSAASKRRKPLSAPEGRPDVDLHLGV